MKRYPLSMSTSTPRTYQSLNDIRAEKDRILHDIMNSEKSIGQQWHALFHQSKDTLTSSPSKRFMGWANLGAGLFDGVLLGWKLYRRFK